MKQIRRSVFETNSSSTHSFTIYDKSPLQQNYMPIDDEGFINVPLIGFCSFENYDTQLEKLAYAVELAAHKSGIYLNINCEDSRREEILEELYESDLFLDIQDQIIAYVGSDCIGIRIAEDASYGYIDDAYDYIDMNDFYEDCGGLIPFIFSDTNLHYEYNG